jgi:ABC-type antimicrobial peptide transport system permease subunit
MFSFPLFERVQFWDPLALGAGAMALATCASVAAILPARRAASISPIDALRTE